MPPDRPSAAQSIYPHLSRAKVSAPDAPRSSVSALAQSMYPHLAPPKLQPQVRSRPQLTRQQIWDWSDIPAEWAAGVGLRRR